jgi:putative two-component system response regulator
MFEKYRILIVEDTARSLITISSYLKDLGVSYKRNTTGIGVLRQTIDVRPDLIMLNLDLPDADAMAIGRSLLQDPRTANIPIIAMADICPAELVTQLLENGFSGCLRKPLSRYVIAQMLERHIIQQQPKDAAQICSD